MEMSLLIKLEMETRKMCQAQEETLTQAFVETDGKNSHRGAMELALLGFLSGASSWAALGRWGDV
jgi:hypothetical protein